LETQTIEITSEEIVKKVYPENCPKCKRPLPQESKFCPECGAKIEPKLVKQELKRKQKKLLKQTAVDLDAIASEFVEDFETTIGDEYAEIDELTAEPPEPVPQREPVDPLKIPRIILQDNPELSIFKGASILGSLESFKRAFVTHAEFQVNPNTILFDLNTLL
jgi:actin-related protein